MSKNTVKMNKTVDMSLDKNQGYATYLPAISSFYAFWASQWEDKMNQLNKDGSLKYPNRHPKKLSKDAKELYFLNDDNGCFHYNAALYSAGHAEIFDMNESKRKEKLVRERNRNNTIVVADSGGFQIATSASGSGVSGFDWNDPGSAENDKIRLAVLRWMESVADYSMMLDVPTHSLNNPNTRLKTFRECLDLTKYNADFFVKNRTPGATKILNVLQGRTVEEADVWWDEFKDYPFEGWALGGSNVRNIEMMLRRIITMRDGKYLDENRQWMHVLGSSKLTTSCILTSIQRAIRETVNENFNISYDSATPFVVAAKGYVFTQNIFEANKKNPRFSYLTQKMIETTEAVGSSRPFPFTSLPGKMLTVGDICVRDPKVSGTSTTWDSSSYVLLGWHNLYRQIDAIQEALRIYDMPSSQVNCFIPENLLRFKDLCSEIFRSERPFDLINKNKKMLHTLTGDNGQKNISILSGGNSDLFVWDNNDEKEFDVDEFIENSEGREQNI